MNKVLLVGRLTRDVDTKYSQDGKAVTRFTTAVDRRYKREGDATADFINCIAFGKTAEFIDKYFQKGSRIGLEGHIQTGSYTNKEGQKVYTTDVIVDQAEFVESKGEKKEAKVDADGFMSIPDGIDEELPFN